MLINAKSANLSADPGYVYDLFLTSIQPPDNNEMNSPQSMVLFELTGEGFPIIDENKSKITLKLLIDKSVVSSVQQLTKMKNTSYV